MILAHAEEQPKFLTEISVFGLSKSLATPDDANTMTKVNCSTTTIDAELGSIPTRAKVLRKSFATEFGSVEVYREVAPEI